MNWVQIVLGALSLAREIVKLMREQEQTKLEMKENIQEFKAATKKARIEGDTSGLETVFKNVISKPNSNQPANKLPDGTV